MSLVGGAPPKLSSPLRSQAVTTEADSPIEIRAADDADLEEIVSVCAKALGWKSPDFDAALFRWKHIDNTFGRSLLLVAVEESDHAKRIVAVRPLMRWQFLTPTGQTIEAARAVDTATLPEAQGKGLFRRLTLRGLEMLEAEGCGFVFNTPNEKSLSGYLSMGWFDAGEVAFGMRLANFRCMARVAQSRSAAEKPSLEVPGLGIDVPEALGSLTPEMLSTDFASPASLRTAHTVDTLRWRFAGGPISYRYLPTSDPGNGAIVRVRQRGQIRELLVAHIIGNSHSAAIETAINDAMATSNADLCVAPHGISKTVRLPKIGPTLALRPLTGALSPTQFEWMPGDIELF